MLSCSNSLISKIEGSVVECTAQMLEEIKVALNAEWLPFNEAQRIKYKERLQRWYKLISEREYEEATKMQEKFDCIVCLSHETELYILFKLIECRLLLGLDNLKDARKILDSLTKTHSLSEFNDMQLYHYYHNQGLFNYKNNQVSKASDFYLNAYGIMKCGFEKDIPLYFNIARSYGKLGYCSLAISFLLKVKDLCIVEPNNFYAPFVDNSLAINYIKTGQLQLAKKLLEECLVTAKKDDNKTYIGGIYCNFGYLYRKDKNYDLAFDYLEKAFDYFEKGSTEYLEVLYQKIRCQVDRGSYIECPKLISEGKKMSRDNLMYTIMFESLSNIITIKEATSIKYLEKRAIPLLLKNNLSYVALDYKYFLWEHYMSNDKNGKASDIANDICKMHKDMFKGGVVE